MTRKLNRRDLLRYLGSATALTQSAPFLTLANAIIMGSSRKAFAQSVGLNPRTFVHLNAGGGPARWMYDLFLNPNNQSGFINNQQIATNYVSAGGRYTSTEYRTVQRNGIYVPWMWQFDVPSVGGNRPSTDLLQNILSLQGLDSGPNNHDAAQAMLYNPLGTLQSIAALSADASSSPIKAIQAGAGEYFYFRSKNNYSATRVGTVNVHNGDNSTNAISELMSAFVNSSSAGFKSDKSQLDSILQAASKSLASVASARHPGNAMTESNRKDAEVLIASSITGLDATWNANVARYQDLVVRATDPTVRLAGINDLPIGTTGTRAKEYLFHDNVCTEADIRNIITNKNAHMSRGFALLEYILLNGLSQSIQMNFPSVVFKHPAGNDSIVQFDEHGTGSMVSPFVNIFNYRAFTACMLELISKLKAAGKFDDTVIMLAGEFGRVPNGDNSGSDHGSTGSHATFYSGAIKGPMVLGNIKKGSTERGTWGEGDKSRDYGHLLSTIAQLVRVPTALTSRPTLVTESGGVITSLIEKTSLV